MSTSFVPLVCGQGGVIWFISFLGGAGQGGFYWISLQPRPRRPFCRLYRESLKSLRRALRGAHGGMGSRLLMPRRRPRISQYG